MPAHAPRDFHEALQSYWFCHLAVITELNGWDAFSPGHLDQHLWPFYQQGLADGTLTRDAAKELLEAFFVKFNNHPAPPKVGVTAAESGTYTDFANINLGGLLPDGSDGSNEVYAPAAGDHRRNAPAAAEQQSAAVAQDARRGAEARLARDPQRLRLSRRSSTPTRWSRSRSARARRWKTPAPAAAADASRPGAFGKEAYILTGYFNLVKVLELALHDGVDPRTGKQLGPRTGRAGTTCDRSTTCSRPSADSCSHFWRSRSAATRSSSRCTPR